MFNKFREFLKSRPVTLTFSIVMLIMTVLFAGDFLKLRGDQSNSARDVRKVIAESLAVQLTSLASISDTTGIKLSVLQFVSRNQSVTAASLVTQDGSILAEYGDLAQLKDVNSTSTLTHLSVPIYHKNDIWGQVNVVFVPSDVRSKELQYYAFVFVGSFLICLVFLRKALIQLDPGRVVPSRVNSAFNMFTEGVVILDDQLKILVVNDAAAKTAGRAAAELIGQDLDSWSWKRSDNWQAPWATALHTGLNISDQPLSLDTGEDQSRIFMVSCTVVGNDEEAMRGVLVTLDDMTMIERKNMELATTLRQLRQSQEAISIKNRELEALATQDPLTGLANRRALLSNFERDFAKSSREGSPLSCLMVDIDHFKRINDSLGHGVGDEIICAVANTLSAESRELDTVGRYGGEEFALVLPGLGASATLLVAERMRAAVAKLAENVTVPVDTLSVSIGIAELDSSVPDVMSLLERADQALYFAKQSGRNRVLAFDADAVKSKHSTQTINTDVVANSEVLSRVVELEAIVQERTKDLAILKDYDSLTGIPQRALFLQRVNDEIERAKRFSTNIGIISLEIKDLGRITSTFGHAASDGLVVEFVARLQAGLRTTDVASDITQDHSMSRITANEYGVLLTDLQESTQAMPVVTRLRRLLSEAFVIDGQKIYIGANIGVSLYPQGGVDAIELLDGASHARSEAAMQSEKVSHCFASNSLDEASKEYIKLETDLFDALKLGQFEVYYQPKFDLARRRIGGMEALLRWHHPEKGFVSPDIFIPIAEGNGLITQISEFVLEQSLEQLVVWRTMGWDHIRLSVNISPKQLRETSLVANILEAIDASGVPPTRVEVELTETSMIESPQRARIVLSQLREAGVSVSMDDFGTGYTSLALLAELPLDSVKIDRSFVDAMATSERSRAIVESVINMAHALKLWVVGEGVETNDQLTTLAALGCNEVQGYLISRPVPAGDMIVFLEQQSQADKVG